MGDPRKGLDEDAADGDDAEEDDNPLRTLPDVIPAGSTGRVEGTRGCLFGDERAIAFLDREESSEGESGCEETGAFCFFADGEGRVSRTPLAALSLRSLDA